MHRFGLVDLHHPCSPSFGTADLALWALADSHHDAENSARGAGEEILVDHGADYWVGQVPTPSDYPLTIHYAPGGLDNNAPIATG